MILQVLTLLLPVPLGTAECDLACLAMEWLSFFTLSHRAFGGLAVAFFRYMHGVKMLENFMNHGKKKFQIILHPSNKLPNVCWRESPTERVQGLDIFGIIGTFYDAG